MSARKWSAREVSAALRLWNDGKSASEIAQIVQRTRNSVIGAMHRTAARKRTPAIGAQRPFGPEEIALIREYTDAGKTLRSMAEATGRTRSSIASKIKRLGLSINRAGIDYREPAGSDFRNRKNKPNSTPKPEQVSAFGTGPKKPNPAPVATKGHGVPMIDATGCGYVVGKRGSMPLVCDAPLKRGSPYCAECHSRCYERRAA